jgi:hypothetical protein
MRLMANALPALVLAAGQLVLEDGFEQGLDPWSGDGQPPGLVDQNGVDDAPLEAKPAGVHGVKPETKS